MGDCSECVVMIHSYDLLLHILEAVIWSLASGFALPRQLKSCKKQTLELILHENFQAPILADLAPFEIEPKTVSGLGAKLSWECENTVRAKMHVPRRKAAQMKASWELFHRNPHPARSLLTAHLVSWGRWWPSLWGRWHVQLLVSMPGQDPGGVHTCW